MSGESLRLVGLDAAFVVVGLAVLATLGLVRDRRAALRYSGLALVLGWAATSLGATVLLLAGIELSAWTVVALWIAITTGSLLVARAVSRRIGPVASESTLVGEVVAIAGATVLVGVLVAYFQRTRASGGFHADVWGFWLPRAKTIFETGGLDLGPGGYASFTHPEYPPLAPTSDAIAFLFMGGEDVLVLPVQHWILFVAFIAAVAGLLAGRVRPAILWPALASLALLPALERIVGSSLADEPLAELFALAGVCGGMWLLERDWRHAALLGLLLAALPMTKKEGLILGAALVVGLGVATRFRPWRTLVPLGIVILLAPLPWRIWHSTHDLRDDGDYRFGDVFDLSFLSDRLDRFAIVAREFPDYVFDPGRWLLTVPLALLLAILLTRRRAQLAAFVVVTLLIPFVGYFTIFWISRPEIRFYLDASAERISTSLVLFAAALIPVLLTEVFTSGDEPPRGPRSS